MSRTGLALAPLVVGLLAGAVALAQTPAPQAPAARAPSAPAPQTRSRYQPDRFAGRAGSYYRLVWGVDSLRVKSVESGEVLGFTYRVLDPSKAKALNDKKNERVRIDPQAGAKLLGQSREKGAQLRQ